MKKFTIKRRVVIEEEVSWQKYVGLKIAEIRKQRKITQDSLANKLGISRTSLVNIEKGRQALTMKNLFTVCQELKLKSKDILPF